MAKRLNRRAWMSLTVLALVLAFLLFFSAGTLRYWQAWAYLATFIGGSALTTLDLMKRDPALLARRMRGGAAAEKRPAQKTIMRLVSICFVAVRVIPALDHRFNGPTVPAWLSVCGDVLVAVGFYFIALVYRENTFTSATIELATNQKVISTGPYAIVRHPMYASG